MPQLRDCPRCHSRFQEGEEFCPNDGARLLLADDDLDARGGDGKARAAPEVKVELGRMIANRFLLEEVLRKSRLAVVYRATHRVLGRPFAIKILRREYAPDQRVLSRFYREAKAASAVDHPNIVSVHDYGQTEDGEPFLAMEYVAGETLRQRKAAQSALGLLGAVDIALQVAQALAHAHQRGVTHRDIQPDNIYLTARDGRLDFVKLLGFGVARLGAGHGAPQLTQMGEVLGTPAYIAPEMWSWSESDKADAPADVYALGVVLHDMLAGSPPFVGERGDVMLQHMTAPVPSLQARRPDLRLPQELCELAGRMLEKDPGARPSAAACAAALEAIRTTLPPQSVNSLLLRETLILDGRRAESLRREAASVQATQILTPRPTVVSDRPVAETVRSGRQPEPVPSGRQPEPVPSGRQPEPAPSGRQPETAPAALLLVMSQLEGLEAEQERLLRRLSDHTDALLLRLYPVQGQVPADVQALIGEIDRGERAEEDQGVQLAVEADHLQKRELDLQHELSALRLRSLELSEELRGLVHGLAPSGGADAHKTAELNPAARAVQAQILECERRAADMEDVALWPINNARQEIVQARAVLAALHAGTLRRRVALARRTIADPGAARYAAERRALEQLATQVESTAATLQRLMPTSQRQ